MLEILKILGSAIVTAAVTIYAMHAKRRWEKQDKKDDEQKSVKDKLDSMTEQIESLSKKVDKLSNELDKEVTYSDIKNRCLQAGLREMLYDRIKYLCRQYIADGQIREEEYKSLGRMWSVYHTDLEGNGYLDSEMTEIDKLEKY